MKKTTVSMLLIIQLAVLALFNCGGGGGGGGGAPSPTHAILALSSNGVLTAGTGIGGLQVTVTLPSGVTAKSSASNANPSVLVTDSGVVAASGSAAGAESVIGTYQTAAASTYEIKLAIVKSAGFSTGEFATITCDIASGSPSDSDFGLSDFTVYDLNGAVISGLSATFTVTVQ